MGQEPVTDAWLVSYHSFIIRVTADNIVVWVIQHSTIDWDYPKTQTLLATLKTLKQLRVSLMYLRKSNIRSHQLDVQETNVCIPQFCRNRNYFVGCWLENGRTTCS